MTKLEDFSEWLQSRLVLRTHTTFMGVHWRAKCQCWCYGLLNPQIVFEVFVICVLLVCEVFLISFLRVKEWRLRQQKKIRLWPRQQWLTLQNRNRRKHRRSKRMTSLKNLRPVRDDDWQGFFPAFVTFMFCFFGQNGTQKTKTKRTRNSGKMIGKMRSRTTLRISWGKLWTETPSFSFASAHNSVLFHTQGWTREAEALILLLGECQPLRPTTSQRHTEHHSSCFFPIKSSHEFFFRSQ